MKQDTQYIGHLKLSEAMGAKVAAIEKESFGRVRAYPALSFYAPNRLTAENFFVLYYRCMCGLQLEEGEYAVSGGY